MTKLCPFCRESMEQTTIPKNYEWYIPWTQISIIIRYWMAQEYLCMWCYREQQKQKSREAYEAGADHGYERGYNDGKNND